MADTANGKTADGRELNRMAKYTEFWDSELKKEGSEHTDNRLAHYTDVVNGKSTYPCSQTALDADSTFADQVTMTLRLSSTSTPGPARSISLASTKAKASVPPSPAMNTTSPPR